MKRKQLEKSTELATDLLIKLVTAEMVHKMSYGGKRFKNAISKYLCIRELDSITELEEEIVRVFLRIGLKASRSTQLELGKKLGISGPMVSNITHPEYGRRHLYSYDYQKWIDAVAKLLDERRAQLINEREWQRELDEILGLKQ